MDVKSSDLHRRRNNNNNKNEGSEREKVEKEKRWTPSRTLKPRTGKENPQKKKKKINVMELKPREGCY